MKIGAIDLMVVEILEGRVRLGVVAPRQVPVHRKEVYLRIKAAAPGGGPSVPDQPKEPL